MLEMPRIQKLWKEKYHRTYSEKDLDKLYNRFEVLLMENLRSFTDPLPNVIEVIENLREQGYNIGSTTGYTTEMMEVVKLGAKEKGYEPDYIVTLDDVGGYGRPYPYMIYENMRKFELNSINELVKVGDTISDIKEAINGGITDYRCY